MQQNDSRLTVEDLQRQVAERDSLQHGCYQSGSCASQRFPRKRPSRHVAAVFLI